MDIYNDNPNNKPKYDELKIHFLLNIEEVMVQVRFRKINIYEGFEKIRMLISNDN